MELSDRRGIEFSPKELTDIVNWCFEGYMVPFVLTPDLFERRFRPEGLDSQSSLIVTSGDEPVGVCLIARQGWTTRVAAMAIAPTFRSQGIGKKLMSQAIQEARARNDRRFLLEVIEQNPAAIGLYESVGMTKSRRLVGHVRNAEAGESTPLTEIDPSIVVRKMILECDANLPWDLKPETLATKPNMVGLCLEDKAFALIMDASPERVVIWSMFTSNECRRQGYGTRMVRALASRFPEKSFMTPVAVPDDLAPEFFESLGFTNFKISQLEMILDL